MEKDYCNKNYLRRRLGAVLSIILLTMVWPLSAHAGEPRKVQAFDEADYKVLNP